MCRDGDQWIGAKPWRDLLRILEVCLGDVLMCVSRVESKVRFLQKRI